MAKTDYKSTDALMRHLRNNGISISGTSQKQQLINTGYFHGYKGYRFFVASSNRLPFTSYNEINATIQYDTYALKDLRNAIAHNDVVYDTRFKKMDPSRPMKQCLILEMGMPYINFKTIGDYIILICYYLKLLKVSKTEIKSFIREFEKITREYEASVNPNVSAITIHPDLFSRLSILKNDI